MVEDAASRYPPSGFESAQNHLSIKKTPMIYSQGQPHDLLAPPPTRPKLPGCLDHQIRLISGQSYEEDGLPIGSFSKSMRTEPARAYAMTRGGEAR